MRAYAIIPLIMFKVKIIMAKNTNPNHTADTKKQVESDTNSSRRTFIKKAAYIAPSLIILGTLSRPTDANARFGRPPSGPAW